MPIKFAFRYEKIQSFQVKENLRHTVRSTLYQIVFIDFIAIIILFASPIMRKRLEKIQQLNEQTTCFMAVLGRGQPFCYKTETHKSCLKVAA